MWRRVASDDFRYDGFISDTTAVWENDAHVEMLEQTDRDKEPATFGRCVRYALIASSIRSIASNYSPSLVARAVTTGLWSPVLALSVASSVTDARRRAAMYTALLATGQLVDVLRRESVIASAREAIRSINDDVSRAFALAELAEQLGGAWREEVVEEGLALALANPEKRNRARALLPLAPLLGGTSINRALGGLREVESQPEEEPSEDGVMVRERAEPWAAAMAAVAARREGVERDAILMHALRVSIAEETEATVASALAALAPRLTPEPARALAEWLSTSIHMVLPATDATVVSCQQATIALLTDIPSGAAAVVAHAESQITLWASGERPTIGHNFERLWAHVLAALADRLTGDYQRWAVSWGLTAALTVAHAKERSLALALYLPRLPDRSRERVAPVPPWNSRSSLLTPLTASKPSWLFSDTWIGHRQKRRSSAH